MQFFRDNIGLYAYEECFSMVLAYRDGEWDRAKVSKEDMNTMEKLSTKQVETITGKDPILEIDKLFKGLECSEYN